MSAEILATLRLTFGPLHYEFIAHDEWGKEALDKLQKHVLCHGFMEPADRILHLAGINKTPEEIELLGKSILPNRFARLLPSGLPSSGWNFVGDETGHANCISSHSRHILFIFDSIFSICTAPFQLPWMALLQDALLRGGGIFHGGLISFENQGFILTARAGGGKTTTISRLGDGWKIHSDDCCLVWPGSGGTFNASPLPTWSVLLGRTRVLPRIASWDIGACIPVVGIFLLKKADKDLYLSLNRREAILPIYQALVEHPRVITNHFNYRKKLFALAYNLTQVVSLWQYEVRLSYQTLNLSLANLLHS